MTADVILGVLKLGQMEIRGGWNEGAETKSQPKTGTLILNPSPVREMDERRRAAGAVPDLVGGDAGVTGMAREGAFSKNFVSTGLTGHTGTYRWHIKAGRMSGEMKNEEARMKRGANENNFV